MSTDDVLKDLWAYIDEHRGRDSSTGLIAQWLDEQLASPRGKGVTPDMISALSMHPGMWQDGHFLTPKPLAEFFARLAGIYSPRSVLDPVCGCGVLLHAVATSVRAETVHGIEINARGARIARALLGENAQIVKGDALSPQPGILDRYDLIVADPPLGMRLTKEQKVGALGEAFRGEFGHALTVWACEHLHDGGAALVIVTPSFLHGPWAKEIRQALNKVSGCIRALIHLRGGTLQSTGTDSYLVLIERGEQQEVFVGQFLDDKQHQEALIKNIKRRKAGAQPALGRLCHLSSFKGFDAFLAQDRLKRLVRKYGWKGICASDLITAHCTLTPKNPGRLEHGPDSCYLRIVGRPIAALDLDDLRDPKQHRISRVLHMHINSKYADPRFLVHWFNTSQIGQATLASLTVGSNGTRIDVKCLLEATFHLPPKDEQLRAIEGEAWLAKIRATADELESRLWSGAYDIIAVVESIKSISLEERLEDWIETLPFPLASILWRYRAECKSPRDRYEALLHFFEATAAYLATVHISAFIHSKGLWKKHGKELNRKLIGQQFTLDRATFGLWKLITEYLSSQCSDLLEQNEMSQLSRMYGTHNRQVLSMISNPELRSVLQKANSIRNSWMGHAGAISAQKAQQIHDELKELLDKLHGIFGRKWLNYELIRPGVNRYEGGIYDYEAKRLMGARTPFETVQRQSIRALESDALYLFDEMSREGMRLVPFVRVMPSPHKGVNACFIFNRRDSSEFRFVSYHFEQESEVKESSQELQEVLSQFHIFDEDEEP